MCVWGDTVQCVYGVIMYSVCMESECTVCVWRENVQCVNEGERRCVRKCVSGCMV